MKHIEECLNKTGVLLIVLAADTLRAAKLRTDLKKIARKKKFPKLAALNKHLDALTEKKRMKGHKFMEEFAEYFPDDEFVAWLTQGKPFTEIEAEVL